MARKEKPMPVRIVNEPFPKGSYKEPDRHHVSMRQIENGWLVNEHGYKDGKHFDRERFTPNAPKIVEPQRTASSRKEHAPEPAHRGRRIGKYKL